MNDAISAMTHHPRPDRPEEGWEGTTNTPLREPLQIARKILIAEVGVPGLIFTNLLPAELDNVWNGDKQPVDVALLVLCTNPFTTK